MSRVCVCAGFLNDLWKYSIVNGQWAWIGGGHTERAGVYGQLGVAAPSNQPGPRQGAVGWYDSATRELWMFGGYSYAGTCAAPAVENTVLYARSSLYCLHVSCVCVCVGYLNDLWKYSIVNGQWAWMGGSNTSGVYGQLGVAAPSNQPGSRYTAVGWYDSATRELWMFGGSLYSSTCGGKYC
jgi:hypothetical protein